MLRRQTYYEKRLGKPPGIDALLAIWNQSLTDSLLSLVWEAYDNVHATAWSKVDWREDYDDTERSLSEDLEREIHKIMDSYLPVTVQHGPSEREARQAPPAQPPEYDIAFVWTEDSRLMWPLEAKVISTDKDTAYNFKDYVDTVKERYLTCYYSPFSNGGAMLGYLKSGDPEQVTKQIAKRLGTPLTAYHSFPSRCHKISDHIRSVPANENYPSDFRLHHLIMRLEPDDATSFPSSTPSNIT